MVAVYRRKGLFERGNTMNADEIRRIELLTALRLIARKVEMQERRLAERLETQYELLRLGLEQGDGEADSRET